MNILHAHVNHRKSRRNRWHLLLLDLYRLLTLTSSIYIILNPSVSVRSTGWKAILIFTYLIYPGVSATILKVDDTLTVTASLRRRG
jgi:hypothetical protein